jgi:hypothetical protein
MSDPDIITGEVVSDEAERTVSEVRQHERDR